MTYITGTLNIPQFTGNIFYVDASRPDDTANGLTPPTAKKTIGAALAIMGSGDAITVKAGTYTETGIDLNKDGCEIWFEIGALLQPASGVALTVSANYCKVTGQCLISPTNDVGVLVSGTNCYFENIFVTGGTSGWQITGEGCEFRHCRSINMSDTGFNIQAGRTRLIQCNTGGTGTNTYGYRINNSCTKGLLQLCTSVDNGASGFYIDSGSCDWTLLDCSSGSGDGKWVDVDSENVWSNFSYDDTIYKLTTFSGTETTYNIFKVTGAVRIKGLIGHVETAIPNTTSTVYIDVYSVNGSSEITDSIGVDIDSVVVGGILVRNKPATYALSLANPDSTPVVLENASFRTPETEVDVIADNSADTYIRLVLSAALASGAIHWHCVYKPLTENSFLEPA